MVLVVFQFFCSFITFVTIWTLVGQNVMDMYQVVIINKLFAVGNIAQGTIHIRLIILHENKEK